MNKKMWVVVSMAVLAGMATMSNARADQQGTSAQNNTQPKIPGTVSKAQEVAVDMTKLLNLTAEQQTKIKDIESRARDAIQAILNDARSKAQELSLKANAEITSLLTPAQKKIFDDFVSAHKPVPTAK